MTHTYKLFKTCNIYATTDACAAERTLINRHKVYITAGAVSGTDCTTKPVRAIILYREDFKITDDNAQSKSKNNSLFCFN